MKTKYGPGVYHLDNDPGMDEKIINSVSHPQSSFFDSNFDSHVSHFLSQYKNKCPGNYSCLITDSCNDRTKCTCKVDQVSVKTSNTTVELESDPSPSKVHDEAHHDTECASDEAHHSEEGDPEETEEDNAFVIKCALINSRGFTSKEASIRNIIVDEDIKVMYVTETQCTLNEFPKIPGFFTFYRNRVKKKGGGVAILIADEFKGKARLLETSKDEMEAITVVLNGFSTPIHLTCYYGQQENTAEKGIIEDHLARLVGDAKVASSDGALVVVAGDFNIKTGDQLTKNPIKNVSKAGKVLIDMLEDSDLHCVNDKDVNNTQFTHVDRSANTSNVLDYILTNSPDQIDEVEIDGGFLKTPNYLRLRDGHQETAFTDHCTILWNIITTKAEEDGRKPKITKWRYDKPGGAEAYFAFLEEQSPRLNEVILTKSTEEAAEEVRRTVELSKSTCYGKTTRTSAKLERMEEAKLWSKRYDELDDFIKTAKEQPGKEMHKIFFARKEIQNKFRYEQPSVIKNLKTGKILKDQKEIDEYTLQYNEELLTKKEVKGEWAELRKEKLVELEEMLHLEDEGSKEPISEEEFYEAVKEVIIGNKDCYLDFLRAGPNFKCTIYALIQKIYLTGEVPKSFKKTSLMKLYKKGDRKLLSNYRFLHLKHWLPKITEKVVMKKLKKKMSLATPPEQLGGVKDASCEEHLVTLMTVLRSQERQKKATAVTFMDVVKCFDQIPLDEVGHSAGQAGIVGKPLKTLMEINADTEMTIVGDTTGKSFIAKNTVGQGLVSACEGSAMVMGASLQRAMKNKTHHLVVEGVKVGPAAFVDDVAQADGSGDGVRSTGKCLTNTLEEVGLEAHPTKSVRVTSGPAPAKKKLKSDLEKDPQRIQGTEVKEGVEERYLGIFFTDKNVRKTISRNIEDKRAKVLVKVKTIKRLLRHPAMERLGWMRAAVGLLQSIVVQTILYGTICFIDMTKQQVKDLEKIQKDAIYDVLGLSRYANYSAVLSEIGILKMEEAIKLRKMSFINKLMHAREVCKCRDILKAEDEAGKYGLLAEVRKYSEEYEFPDLTKDQILKGTLKRQFKETATRRNWIQTLKSKKALARWESEKTSNRAYFSFAKLESKLMLALMIGELNFLTNRRAENIKKLGSTHCYIGVCGGEDSLEHVSQCFGYSAVPSGDGSERSQVEYLVELNKERMKRFGTALIYYDRN